LIRPLGGQSGSGVAEENHVRTQLSPEQRAVDRQRSGRDDADGPVARFPAVAIGTVEHVAAPSLGDARNRRQFVAQASGDEQPSRPRLPPVGERHRERAIRLRQRTVEATRRDARDVDDFRAIRFDFRPAGRQQVARRHAFAGQVVMDVAGRRVARIAAVDDQHPPSRTRERQRRVQARGAADDRHVVWFAHWIDPPTDNVILLITL
jgi:hypothetical protein